MPRTKAARRNRTGVRVEHGSSQPASPPSHTPCLCFTYGRTGAYGLGDIEFGLKYRFIQETDHLPMVGVFPLLEIPTGDSDRGLGNGQAWWRFHYGYRRVGDLDDLRRRRLCHQSRPGAAQLLFWWLATAKRFRRQTDLGGIDFRSQERAVMIPGPSRCSIWEVIFKITQNFNPVFRAAIPLQGQQHTLGYLRLYWTG